MIAILKNIKNNIIFALVVIFLISILLLYLVNRIISPSVISYADMEIKSRATTIINEKILEEYTKEFNYDNIINVEKNNEGNITLLKADTLKMNRIACDVALATQKELKSASRIKISIPLGYVFNNNLIAFEGPKIPVFMEPVGYIETKYLSQFETAGINQTRHKIYVIVKTNIKVIVPTEKNEIEVKCEIPIAETIIVGEIPNTSIGLDLRDGGVKLRN